MKNQLKSAPRSSQRIRNLRRWMEIAIGSMDHERVSVEFAARRALDVAVACEDALKSAAARPGSRGRDA